MTPTETSAALITAHLPVVGHEVASILHRLPRHIPRDELVAAGNLGLVQAARNYDPATGVSFHRWAKVRIRGAILDELRSVDWLSRGARRRAKRVGQVAEELATTLGRPATLEEVAAATGLSVEEVMDGRADADTRIASLDAFDGPYLETITDDELVGPEDSVLTRERLVYLRAAVTSLPDRLRTVIEGLFFADRTIPELAEELGVTVSRVSQLKTEAMALMRDAMNASLDPALVEPVGTGVAERRRRAFYARVAAQAAAASTVRALPTPVPAPDRRREALEACA